MIAGALLLGGMSASSEDVATGWLAQVTVGIRRAEYEFSLFDGDAWSAPNRAHGLRAKLAKGCLALSPRLEEEGAWSLELRLQSFGREGNLAPLDSVTPVAQANRLELVRPELTEWYINDDRGLEQGFIIASAPHDQDEERPMILELSFSGGLRAIAAEDGQSVLFTRPTGTAVLRYGDLLVKDSTGRTIPARVVLFPGRLQIRVEDNGAIYPLVVDPLLSSPVWTQESNQAGALFGFSASTAGDVNGDGFSDVIVGAPNFDTTLVDAGRAYVFLGSASGLAASAAWVASGEQAGELFGSSVASAGDTNGDGFSDVIVGSPGYTSNPARPLEGRASLYRGSASGLAGSAVWRPRSLTNGARFGFSVATAGDLNGDGLSDVVIGAPDLKNTLEGEGRVYVFYGPPLGDGAASNRDYNGQQAFAHFGWAVGTAGDINGDGFSDLIAGAPDYTNGEGGEGRIFAYLGSISGLPATASLSREVNQAGAAFGTAVSTAGDINGDGYSDVIVGAPGFDAGQSDEGRAFVFLGSATGLGLAAAWSVGTNQASTFLGSSVSTAGDINGDGYADVIVGAPSVTILPLGDGQGAGVADEGQAFLFLGSAAGLEAAPAWTGTGGQAAARYGAAVATAGDVNGDGFSDVLVGASFFDNAQLDEGRAFVYLGSAGGPALAPGWTRTGGQDTAHFAGSVATAGDVNGDGFSDVVVGAADYDNGEDNEGRAFVFLGSPSGLATSPAWTAESNQQGAGFGISVGRAGDVNGDGFSDVIVGAWKYDNGEQDEGRAYVFLGSASGLAANPAWTAEADQVGAGFGISVSTAGDVNGDGFSDVIVGAWLYDAGEVDEGRTFVFLGSAQGLAAQPVWTGESNQAGARYGISVATAGDVNRDGRSDIIVGADFYTTGAPRGGKAFVYLGTGSGLAATPVWTDEIDQDTALFGASVASAGDVNGDGFSDIVVGARRYDDDQVDEGRVFVYLGSLGGPSLAPAWTADGNQVNAQFGNSVASAGDVNNDGFSDLAVTSFLYSNGQVQEGRALVYLGSSTGLASAPAWTAESDRASGQLGVIASAGDVNGDGFGDIIAGAAGYTGTLTAEGQAYFFYGNGTDGLDRIPRQGKVHSPGLIDSLAESDAEDMFRLRTRGRTPAGRGKVLLEWEVKRLVGPLFDGAGLRRGSTFVDTGAPGPSGSAVDLAETAQDLLRGTAYKWRLRSVASPVSPFFPRSPWLSLPYNGRLETDLRTAPSAPPLSIASLTLDPPSVTGGQPSRGTVTLREPAPPGGASVVLMSSDAGVASVPPTVSVPTTALTTDFNITTQGVPVVRAIEIDATYLTDTKGATLTVLPTFLFLHSLDVDPASVKGGSLTTGTAVLNGHAPPGGASVLLVSDNPVVAAVPASVTVPAGATSANFPVTTSAVAALTCVTVSGAYGGVNRSAGVTLLPTSSPPALVSLNLSPENVIPGSPSTGTVTLSAAAPAEGIVVSLASSRPMFASVPSSIMVPAGATMATFNVSTAPFLVPKMVTISATYNGVEKTDELTFGPLPAAQPEFHRGDSDGNGQLQLTDAVRILGFLFLGQAPPTCLDAGDADGNNQLQLTDAVRILGFLFLGQAPPVAPGPPPAACGVDNDDTHLGCASYTMCPQGGTGPEIHYRGTEIVLEADDSSELGPGAVLHFDMLADSSFEKEVHTDTKGFFAVSLDASSLPNPGKIAFYTTSADGSRRTETVVVNAVRDSASDPSSAVPVNLASGAEEPGICSCTSCSEGRTANGSSCDAFSHSYTPSEHGIELATGKHRRSLPVAAFPTRLLGFDLHLEHVSLLGYDGPVGQGFSHSYNMMLVKTGERTGKVITSDLRIFPITSTDGLTWTLPVGFFSKLALDPSLGRWTLTHYSGLELVFYEGAIGHPGRLLWIREPNGNRTSFAYDYSGLLQTITTDLGQVETLTYDGSGRLSLFTDHIGREWRFVHDGIARLLAVETPETEFADVGPGEEVTDENLATVLTNRRRVTRLAYDDARFLSHMTAITDERDATPVRWTYASDGRVQSMTINGAALQINYAPVAGPAPLATLDAGNRTTRVTDRMGNVCDYEIHGPGGDPRSSAGAFGIRRRIQWTESGKGNAPLRAGEPLYWEQRWIQDCDCLAPRIVVEPFESTRIPTLAFDTKGIPTNWPHTLFEFNDRRQVTQEKRTDGTNSIMTQSTFSSFETFSRLLTRKDARAFEAQNPLYAGLDFTHTFSYDVSGNRTGHTSPTVTRGVNEPQRISESFTYNSLGQILTHTNPNGNIVSSEYFDGPSTGGDINTQGSFGGYIKSMTRGAAGSQDPAAEITTRYRVNALGMVTETSDPRGFVYATTYNDVGEAVAMREPRVTLRNQACILYETRTVYDGAGYPVLERRSNVDFDGTTPQNEFVDTSRTFDDVGNLLSVRVEVDGSVENDLIARFAYDRNDLTSIIQRPEGNRTFHVRDERNLPFRTFHGVARHAVIDNAYPQDPRAVTLGGTTFVSLTIATYDARRNRTETRDGRGNSSKSFYDFADRRVGTSDPNGNGMTQIFDDRGLRVLSLAGAVDRTTGVITQVLSRSYDRFDELGRRYQSVQDLDLQTDESLAIDPTAGVNSSERTFFDPGSRAIRRLDARSNPTDFTYDAAGRTLTVTDALGNIRTMEYDESSNLVRVRQRELPGPGATGSPEQYATEYDYDELNRRTGMHIRGLGGDSIDHYTFFSYDSRNNERLIQDAEDKFTLRSFDDLNRTVAVQRFAGDPLAAGEELSRSEHLYDRNGNKVADEAFGDVSDPGSVQSTRYGYDDLDRGVRTVFPDSDDPVSGAGNGTDGVFDRVDVVYDANSNPTQTTDQRGVVIRADYDAGNRLTRQTIILPASVPGVTRQDFSYDALNRPTLASNNYARVDRAYDALSRLVGDTQSIRLDGSGFTNGWEEPIEVRSAYDPQSNRTSYEVVSDGATDLAVTVAFDTLNREGRISASYFDTSEHTIADYLYFGPGRIQSKVFGNGARLTNTFDVKERISGHTWRSSTGDLLVGFQYDYDRVDNVLHEIFEHDGGLSDNFGYNARYEVTGVNYRAENATDYRASGLIYDDTFTYNDTFSRTAASQGDPFNSEPNTEEAYSANAANEYTQVSLDGTPTAVAHDRAGNMTTLPVRPAAGQEAGNIVSATARWDAFNCLFDIQAGANAKQHYRYDPFRRRVATLELSNTTISAGSRRYIYDGWNDVEERIFEQGATLASGPSRLERIYVNGKSIDEPILAATDGNSDGDLSDQKNVPGIGNDAEYCFLENGHGSISAITSADQSRHVLEYYKYTCFGKAFVAAVKDLDGDGLEDSPHTLNDNLTPLRMASGFGNTFVFHSRRLDLVTGLYYFRNRYYDATAGRFSARDPLGPWSHDKRGNPYSGMNNNVYRFIDPLGLAAYLYAGKREDIDSERSGGGSFSVDDLKAAVEALEGKVRRWGKKLWRNFFGPNEEEDDPVCDHGINCNDYDQAPPPPPPPPPAPPPPNPPPPLPESRCSDDDVDCLMNIPWSKPDSRLPPLPESRCTPDDRGCWLLLLGGACEEYCQNKYHCKDAENYERCQEDVQRCQDECVAF
jgi:RHS repeat-associated protein